MAEKKEDKKQPKPLFSRGMEWFAGTKAADALVEGFAEATIPPYRQRSQDSAWMEYSERQRQAAGPVAPRGRSVVARVVDGLDEAYAERGRRGVSLPKDTASAGVGLSGQLLPAVQPLPAAPQAPPPAVAEPPEVPSQSGTGLRGSDTSPVGVLLPGQTQSAQQQQQQQPANKDHLLPPAIRSQVAGVRRGLDRQVYERYGGERWIEQAVRGAWGEYEETNRAYQAVRMQAGAMQEAARRGAEVSLGHQRKLEGTQKKIEAMMRKGPSPVNTAGIAVKINESMSAYYQARAQMENQSYTTWAYQLRVMQSQAEMEGDAYQQSEQDLMSIRAAAEKSAVDTYLLGEKVGSLRNNFGQAVYGEMQKTAGEMEKGMEARRKRESAQQAAAMSQAMRVESTFRRAKTDAENELEKLFPVDSVNPGAVSTMRQIEDLAAKPGVSDEANEVLSGEKSADDVSSDVQKLLLAMSYLEKMQVADEQISMAAEVIGYPQMDAPGEEEEKP